MLVVEHLLDQPIFLSFQLGGGDLCRLAGCNSNSSQQYGIVDGAEIDQF